MLSFFSSSSDRACQDEVRPTDENLKSYKQKKESQINRFKAMKALIDQKQSAWGAIVETLESAQSHPEDDEIKKKIYATLYDLHEIAQKLKDLQREWFNEDISIYNGLGLGLCKRSSFLNEIHKTLHSAEKNLESVLRIANHLINTICDEVEKRNISLPCVKRSELESIVRP